MRKRRKMRKKRKKGKKSETMLEGKETRPVKLATKVHEAPLSFVGEEQEENKKRKRKKEKRKKGKSKEKMMTN